MNFNTLLRILNVAFLALSIFTFRENGENEYVNTNTILLGVLLAVQINFFLVRNKKEHNPFIYILCLQLILYYLLRLTTLIYIPYSIVLSRFDVTGAELNYSIFFMIVANFAFYAGLMYARKNIPYTRVDESKLDVFNYKASYMLAFFIIALLLGSSTLTGVGPLDQLLNFFKLLFLNPSIIIFFLIVFLSYRYKQMKRWEVITFVGIITGYIVLQTMSGSRQGILVIGMYGLFALLSSGKQLVIKIRYFVLAFMLLPVAVFSFVYATTVRSVGAYFELDSRQTLELITESYDQFDVEQEQGPISLIFNRIGFLDYGAEVIARKKEYSSIFNIPYYLKSVVDNFLSPGFTVFDNPKVANAMIFIYGGFGKPSLTTVNEYYTSDQSTMYGEFYALAGWGSLILFVMAGYWFQKLYQKVEGQTDFEVRSKQAFLIFIFYQLINSFGLDWLFFNVVALYCTWYFFKRMVLKKRDEVVEVELEAQS